MEDLTSKLRRLATRRPSKSLDERVLGVLESQPLSSQARAPRIGLGWAIAAAALVGAIGFWAGLTWGGAPGGAPGGADRPGAPHNVDHSPESKTIQVVVSSRGTGNPFDFSLPLEDSLVGEWKTEIRLNEDPTE